MENNDNSHNGCLFFSLPEVNWRWPSRKAWLVIGVVAAGLVLIGVLTGCNTSATPTACLDAPKNAGVPEKFLEHLSNPGDLNAIERIALRKALEAAGVGNACESVTS